MGKTRNLRGLPHNMAKSFFGTMRYQQGGYMADHLVAAAERENVDKGHLDVFAGRVFPVSLHLPVFEPHIKDLRWIIEAELLNNGFPTDFVVEAKIELEFPGGSGITKPLYCYPYIIDKEGKRYAPGRLIEYAYEVGFQGVHADTYSEEKSNLLKIIRDWFRFK
jgi:hypothetical protein